MLDPATSTALVGAGTWFGNKLLGPTADMLGEQLNVFVSARWQAIFQKTEKLSEGKALKPLPPAFAYIALQHAAISEDSDVLTEMWAHLLIGASENFSQAHMNFADILGQLGSREATLLNRLVPGGETFSRPVHAPVNLKGSLRERLRRDFEAVCVQAGTSHEEMIAEAQDRHNRLYQTNLGWPGMITAIEYPYSDIHNSKHGTISGGQPISSSHDVLVRERLLEPFSFDLNQSFSSPYIEGFLVSILGVEFVLACRGER